MPQVVSNPSDNTRHKIGQQSTLHNINGEKQRKRVSISGGLDLASGSELVLVWIAVGMEMFGVEAG